MSQSDKPNAETTSINSPGIAGKDLGKETIELGKPSKFLEPEESLISLHVTDAHADDKLDPSEKKDGATVVESDHEGEDPWNAPELARFYEKPWSQLTKKEKWIKVVLGVVKLLGVLILLYFFICALELLSMSLRLMSGKSAGKIFSETEILQNPIAGLMIGILFTVMVQSSSTSTSVVVSMVSSGLLSVKSAVPIIMGSNIGTSITNTIVSLTQAGDRNQFRRAFSGATVHDMFNGLTAVILLVLEIATNYLQRLTGAIVEGISNSSRARSVNTLSVITKPFVHLIMQFDKKNCWFKPPCNESKYNGTSLIDRCTPKKCKKFLFAKTTLNDTEVGGILFVLSLLVICGTLIGIVKLLNSMMKGNLAKVIKKAASAKIPHCPWLTGYLLLFVGAGITFLLQSSSVFTSALTPLVGIGVISIEVMYPLTLGSNIGTTSTALLASFATDEGTFKEAVQVALCHLFFNLSGIIIFYPIPFMRWPIFLAKGLGTMVAQFRWVAILYIVVCFFILPGIFLALSIAGLVFALVFVLIIFAFLLFIIIVNVMQRKCPRFLSKCLRTWDCLPLACRSFQPYDDLLSKCKCKCCCKLQDKGKTNDGKGSLGTHPLEIGRQASNISLNSFSIQPSGDEGDMTGGKKGPYPESSNKKDSKPNDVNHAKQGDGKRGGSKVDNKADVSKSKSDKENKETGIEKQ